MIINNFHKVIFITTVQVFHQHYYDEVTQVKCSLCRSDGDSNRFLTSWWFIPYTNLTHPLKWGIDHRVNYLGISSLLGTTCTRGPTDCSLVLSSRPHVLPHLLQHSALRAIYSARIISQLHGRKVLYSASYGMRSTWPEVQQRSVLNRHRRKALQSKTL